VRDGLRRELIAIKTNDHPREGRIRDSKSQRGPLAHSGPMIHDSVHALYQAE